MAAVSSRLWSVLSIREDKTDKIRYDKIGKVQVKAIWLIAFFSFESLVENSEAFDDTRWYCMIVGGQTGAPLNYH